MTAGDAESGIVGEDRLLGELLGMGIFHDREDRVDGGRRRFLEQVKAFVGIPAVVAAANNVIDFLPPVLTDVGDPEAAGQGIERQAPGIAKTEGPDFGPDAGALRDEGIVLRDAVAAASGTFVDVQPQYFAQQGAEILSVVVGVVRRSAVAESDVEMSVRSEGQGSGIMVAVGLGDLQEHPFGRHVGLV